MLKKSIPFFINAYWKPTYVSSPAIGTIRDETIKEKAMRPAFMKFPF